MARTALGGGLAGQGPRGWYNSLDIRLVETLVIRLGDVLVVFYFVSDKWSVMVDTTKFNATRGVNELYYMFVFLYVQISWSLARSLRLEPLEVFAGRIDSVEGSYDPGKGGKPGGRAY